MVFSSLVFLFRFMPVVFGVYYICPKKLKNSFLLIASIIFYAWGDPKYLPLILIIIIKDYFIGIGIGKSNGRSSKAGLLLLSVVSNVGILAYFKYADFLIGTINGIFSINIGLLNLALPVGISFYTFQSLAYTIDVYRGDTDSEKNIIDYAMSITLFPQLIAGPIVKYTQIKDEIKNRTISMEEVQSGVFTFIMGLGSKVLLANNLSTFWKQLEETGFVGISMPMAWLGLVFYGLQLYFDFSGYSLMAIGMGKMLGFHFPQNFDYPYTSVSISEFWRRWHMTLGSWFRDYVYIPLGGSRKGSGRTYLNLFVVWALTGLWHGANWNFVLWGLFFFVFICIEKAFLLKKLEKHRLIGHAYIIVVMLFSWALFAITDFSQLVEYIKNLFSFRGGTDWIYPIRNYGVLLILSVFLALPIGEKIAKNMSKGKTIAGTIVAGFVLVFSIAYLVDSTYNPFLYFKF